MKIVFIEKLFTYFFTIICIGIILFLLLTLIRSKKIFSNKNRNFLIKEEIDGVLIEQKEGIFFTQYIYNMKDNISSIKLWNHLKVKSTPQKIRVRRDLGKYFIEVTKEKYTINLENSKVSQPNVYKFYDMFGKNFFCDSLKNFFLINIGTERLINTLMENLLNTEIVNLNINNNKQLIEIFEEIDERIHKIIKKARNIFEYNFFNKINFKIYFLSIKSPNKSLNTDLIKKILGYSKKSGIFFVINGTEELYETLKNNINILIVGNNLSKNKWFSQELNNEKDCLFLRGEEEKRIIIT